jgi:pectate lyase
MRPGGWAGLYENQVGGAVGNGVTGGKGGQVFEFTDWDTLWAAYVASPSTTPQIYRYTGASGVSIGANNRWTVENKKNKTLEANNGQLLTQGEIRHNWCENIVVRNISRKGPYVDRTEGSSSTDYDYFTFNGCIGYWVDHVDCDGEEVWAVTGSLQHVDGAIDNGFGCDFGTISNSSFKGCARVILIAYNNTEFENRGKYKTTIRHNLFENSQNRVPMARFGLIGIHNNLRRWNPRPDPFPVTAREITVNTESEFYVYREDFDNGLRMLNDADAVVPPESGIILDDCIVGDYIATNITLGPPVYREEFRTGNVSWNPKTLEGYDFVNLLTKEEVEAYVLANAGANLTLASYNLNVSKSGSGTVSNEGNSTWTNLDEITLTASPSIGNITEWRLGSSSGTLLATGNSYTFEMPSDDLDIVAVFVSGEGGNPTFSLSSTTGGTVSSTPTAGTITAGTSITLSATPDSGFLFSAWRLNTASGSVVSTNPNYSFNMPSSDYTLVGVFVSDTPIPPGNRKGLFKKRNT